MWTLQKKKKKKKIIFFFFKKKINFVFVFGFIFLKKKLLKYFCPIEKKKKKIRVTFVFLLDLGDIANYLVIYERYCRN
jgi:hypothetical protein